MTVPDLRCKTCLTDADECMRLRAGRPMRFCCDACAVIGSHYDDVAAPGRDAPQQEEKGPYLPSSEETR